MDKKIIMCIIGISAIMLWLYDKELYGDAFRLMLIPLGALWLIKRDFTKLKCLILVAGIILFTAFSYMANHYADIPVVQDFVDIAKRPINGEFKGFPSGHTTAAFTAAAFMWHFLGKQWGLFGVILAIFVGYSRTIGLWHTHTQVIAGAILGFFGSIILIVLTNKLTKNTKKDYNRQP